VVLAATHEAAEWAWVGPLGAPLAHHVTRPQVPVVAQGNPCKQTSQN